MPNHRLDDRRGENGTPLGSVSGDFTDADVATVEQYVAGMTRLRDTAFLRRGLPGITRIKLTDNGLTLECAPYKDSELHALLHVLRPLILERERASFDRVAGRFPHRIKRRSGGYRLRGSQVRCNNCSASNSFSVLRDGICSTNPDLQAFTSKAVGLCRASRQLGQNACANKGDFHCLGRLGKSLCHRQPLFFCGVLPRCTRGSSE